MFGLTGPVQGSEPGFWDVRTYEYWDAAAQQWTLQQPAVCLVKGLVNPNPRTYEWRNGSPRTAADCKDYYCTYENLWCARWEGREGKGGRSMVGCLGNGCDKPAALQG